jgi:hypothetical protein
VRPANAGMVELIDDPDIFRAAKLLIDQHAEHAAFRAAQRAGALVEDGDLDGSAVWRRIWRRSRSCGAAGGEGCQSAEAPAEQWVIGD